MAKPKSLVVLPQGARSTDPYRLSPDELLSLGAIAKRKGDVAAATRYYTELLDSWHGQPGFGLSEAAYKQTIFALMELGMGRRPRPGWSSTAKSSRRNGPRSRSRSINC